EAGWLTRYKTVDEFLNAVAQRKRNLQNDFERFYKELIRNRKANTGKDYDLKIPGRSVEELGSEAKRAGVVKIDEDFVADVIESGWQGKSVPIDLHDFEDMNGLFWYDRIGSPTSSEMAFRFQAKILPDTEKRIWGIFEDEYENFLKNKGEFNS